MKQKLIALALAVGALGAGGALFFNWESATVSNVIEDVGNWEQVDRSSCTSAACNTTQCQVAKDHLLDAGSACVPRLVDCDFRVSNRMRACLSDAGVTLNAKKYQRLELVALRCPGKDGGLAFGTPFDDAGCPVYASLAVTPLCVRAPLDGGLTCRRDEHDGGSRFFGTGNVFPATEAAGSNCEAVSCRVFYGDDANTSL